VEAPVAPSEQLIAAADGEERCTAVEHRLLERLAFRCEVPGNEQLLPVLAAADVIEVVLAGNDRVVHPEWGHRELVPAERGAPGEHGDVAAIRVDVQVLGIEVADPDRRHAVCSQ
jgi:hypothetical protein